MTPEVLPELARLLELAVIERLPNAGYIMVTPPPGWLAGALDTSATLKGAFPFLGHFLPIAGEAWHAGGSERRDSGPFEFSKTVEFCRHIVSPDRQQRRAEETLIVGDQRSNDPGFDTLERNSDTGKHGACLVRYRTFDCSRGGLRLHAGKRIRGCYDCKDTSCDEV